MKYKNNFYRKKKIPTNNLRTQIINSLRNPQYEFRTMDNIIDDFSEIQSQVIENILKELLQNKIVISFYNANINKTVYKIK